MLFNLATPWCQHLRPTEVSKIDLANNKHADQSMQLPSTSRNSVATNHATIIVIAIKFPNIRKGENQGWHQTLSIICKEQGRALMQYSPWLKGAAESACLTDIPNTPLKVHSHYQGCTVVASSIHKLPCLINSNYTF